MTCYGRDRTVLISAEEHHRLKRRGPQVLGLEDFTETDLQAIRSAKPASGSAKFNPEVE